MTRWSVAARAVRSHQPRVSFPMHDPARSQMEREVYTGTA